MPEVRSFVLAVVAAALGAAPAHAAAPGRPGQADDERGTSVLVSAILELDVRSPTEARVHATLSVRGDGPFVLLWTVFPGQRLGELSIVPTGRAEVTAAPSEGRVQRATVRPIESIDRIEIRYSIEGNADAGYRFPLPVPDLGVETAESAVRLAVRLPAGSRYAGDAFPRLERSAGADAPLTTTLVAVPAFVHVVFGEAAGRVGRHRQFEALGIGVALVVLALIGWRTRRGELS